MHLRGIKNNNNGESVNSNVGSLLEQVKKLVAML